MKIKNGLIFSSVLFIIILFSAPLVGAQKRTFDWVQVSAYGTDLVTDDPLTGSFSFIVAAPPSGSEILNSISVHDIFADENYTTNLSVGDRIYILYSDLDVQTLELNQASEPGHFNIFYVGEGMEVFINSAQIPEFPSLLVIFVALIGIGVSGIFYKKKLRT
ncbi:MAG: hypothetical protein P8X91_03240 [Candidatus Bathyarchaeota archaeon]|jgi:hypothetical protein